MAIAGLILQVILALPKIIGLIKDLIASYYNYQTDQRVKRANEALKELEKAGSDEARDKAAQDVINNSF